MPLSSDLARYTPLVVGAAKRLHCTLPYSSIISIDDLIQVGMVGLMQALDEYEDKGYQFTTYANARVKGAMLDELRKHDHLPRKARVGVGCFKKTRDALTASLGRFPTRGEIAAKMGVSLNDCLDIEMIDEFAFITLTSDENKSGEADLLENLYATEQTPLDILIEKNALEVINCKMKDLPEKQRLAMQLYYGEGLRMKEVGETIGVSESRVCQLLSRAVAHLKEQYF
jgi:RNA polymerase sigma factor for flagellar operon FliA